MTNSSFTGGLVGVFASGDMDASGNVLPGAPHFDVLNSTFREFSFSGIQHQVGSNGLISGNAVSACGVNGCIRTVLDGQVEVSGNSVTVEADRTVNTAHLRFGIFASNVAGGAHVITGNTVTGVGVGPTGYAIEQAGIRLGPVAGVLGNATVSRNIVVNAVAGLSVADHVMTGTDNVMTGVSVGIAAVSVSQTTSVSLNRSDVTSYVVPMVGDGLADLTCNWWGSAVGPQNVPVGIPASVFTPFATTPIANNAGVACGSGAIGAPSINRSLTAPLTQQLVPATTGVGTAPFKRPVML